MREPGPAVLNQLLTRLIPGFCGRIPQAAEYATSLAEPQSLHVLGRLSAGLSLSVLPGAWDRLQLHTTADSDMLLFNSATI